MAEDKNTVCCSFCGKTQDEVVRLVAGPGVYICDECIELCNAILDEEFGRGQRSRKKAKKADSSVKLMKPQELKARLDEYVIGQDQAKITLSVAVYNHYKRIFKSAETDVELS